MKFPALFTLALVALSTLCTQRSFAIGDQHGVFRSQSTQGAQWTGTATIEEEEFRITVHPNYLDVELDWVFRVGGQAPEKFADALEIVGNLNLAKSSVVAGMLTWWQGDILKGKLKSANMARADYENVVQRDADAPPPPRDPVLIEYGWGIDNYYISIFPAKFGETRKVRLHYLIPASSMDGIVKMTYPHAFSENTKVSIRAGSDIAGYKIEAGKDPVLRTNKALETLSASEYSFHAYGGSTKAAGINAIIPILANEGAGSRFYIGDVNTPNLQGQAAHVVVMDAEKIIAQSNLKEDFVILWRWSHPRLLELYAGQIVSQSKLLKTFLAKLEGANKRAALIIDKEGGERVIFTLAKSGDAGHKDMLAYLDSLAALTVLEPTVTSAAPNYNLTVDAAKAQSEFEASIQAAIKLFEVNDNIRHLLVLTAGPRIINVYSNQTPMKLDSTIHIGGLGDYLGNLTGDAPIGNEDRTLYWPGANPAGILSKQTLNLNIEAVVSNGSKVCTLSVAAKPEKGTNYQGSRSEIEKHIFSSAALLPKVSWKISQEDKVLASFEETARLIAVENTGALSKIMGASRALTPMADEMPRSMAATVGFIDSSYSLVALEEDKLSAADATTFAAAGVPDLFAADIKATPEDLAHLTTEAWLKENPPQKIWDYGSSYNSGLFFEREVMFDMATPNAQVKGAGNPGAFMPIPIAGDLGAPTTGTYPDYTKDLALGILSKNKPSGSANFATIRGRSLILDLTRVNASTVGELQLEIYTLNGTLIHSRNLSGSSTQGTIELAFDRMPLRRGVYLIQLRSAKAQYRQKLMLP